MSQAGRARQLYVTISARAFVLCRTHVSVASRHFCCLGTVQSNQLLYRQYCVCVYKFALYVLRAKGAWCMFSFHFYVCVCVFFVLLTSVSPLICRDSAVLMKAGRASCLTFTSPQYINWIRSFSAE